MPRDIGADHCRLPHIGWEKCGHGLTSRPRESASEGSINELLLLLRYPPRSAAALLEVLCLFGTVLVGLLVGFPLGAFLLMLAPLTISRKGVRMLVVLLQLCLASKVVMEVTGLVGLVEALKTLRLTRQTPAPLVRHGILGIQSQPLGWKRLRVQDHSGQYHADAKARRVHQDDEAYVLVQDRTGFG